MNERDAKGHYLVSRFADGGFEPRFIVRRADGNPCRPDARFMVMDGSGADPHAWLALKVYAASVRSVNAKLADDLERMLGNEPCSAIEGMGGLWPVELAQHGDAK